MPLICLKQLAFLAHPCKYLVVDSCKYFQNIGGVCTLHYCEVDIFMAAPAPTLGPMV